ncbi:hypothetical protein K474DRAFT_1760469 [Panus rudis PR-1116 ss-1]|nr:hypothetical protein K474DRAFT_1760469 [Panus rudis PR-1116 ss-1]
MLSNLQYRKLWQKAGLAEENVTCIGLSPDGEYLAVGGRKEISLLTTQRGDIKCCLRGRGQVTGLQWSPEGTLVGTFEDRVIVGVTLSVRNTQRTSFQNGQLDLTCEEAQSHQMQLSSLDTSGSRLATGSLGDVRIWERDGDCNSPLSRKRGPEPQEKIIPVES